MLNILVVSNGAKEIYALFNMCDLGFLAQETHSAESPYQLNPAQYDLAFLDLDDGGWRERLLDLRQQMPVVVFSKPDIGIAVEAMRLGACDYLEKPLTCGALGEIVSRYRKRMLNNKYGFDEIIGASGPMQEVFGHIKKAAASESNVLVTGESGTGKELVARAIHRWSPRSEGAFMTINCGAIPDTLLESELFGFEKGSFTGANYTKKGLLELADGGTVFFDEIGDVSPMFQVKILRVLQEGEIMRIGGTRQIRVDVRIIAATNKDLKSACQRGVFREDLFYRLNVINIQLPPLRERVEDIPQLAGHFVKKHAPKRKDMMIKGVSEESIKVLLRHEYPGNVRELENIIESAISFAGSPEILPSDLPAYLLQSPARSSSSVPKMKNAISAFERELIVSALNESGGNISRAAATLGIYRQQLQRKMRSLKIAT